MNTSEVTEEKKKLEAAITKSVANKFEQFVERTGVVPDNVAINVVTCYEVGHPPRNKVASTTVTIEL